MWNTGIHEIISTGTLLDFFTTIKNVILANTDFELIENDDLSLTFDTNIEDITMIIQDKNIASSEETTTSNSISIVFMKNNVQKSSFNVLYVSSAISSSDATRKIYITTLCTNNLKLVSFESYSFTSLLSSWNTSTSFGMVKTKKISDSSDVTRCFIGNSFYNDNLDTLARYTPLSYPVRPSGVVLQNIMLVYSNYIYEYCDTVFNCSTVTAGSYYMIDNKKYYAITTNILVSV